jgi:hypothetical protein
LEKAQQSSRRAKFVQREMNAPVAMHPLRKSPLSKPVGGHMADITYRSEIPAFSGQHTSWGAIWCGLFTFVAIWAVFGMLGEAIFASSSNPSSPGTGAAIGMGIWAIVLTFISMYVAGRVTGHLSNALERMTRIEHGTAMFGLSVLAVVLMVVLSGMALSTNNAAAAGATGSEGSYMMTVFSSISWVGFICLFLGWIGAIAGAAHGPSFIKKEEITTTSNVHDMRPAA